MHTYIHRGDDDCLKFLLLWFSLLPVNEATNTHYEEEQNHSVDVYWIRINYKLGLEEITSSLFILSTPVVGITVCYGFLKFT